MKCEVYQQQFYKDIEMNIRTSYPIQPAQTRTNQMSMQNNSVPVKENNTRELASSSVCFTGLGSLLRKSTKMNAEAKDFLEHAAQVLDVDAGKIFHMAQGKTQNQMRFLGSMVEHFNAQNFYAVQEHRVKEDGNVVLELFKRVLKPKDEHFAMVERSNLSMTNIKKCFDACEDNPKKLKKIQQAYEELGRVKEKDNLIIDIVESPNASEYIDNMQKYLPHFEAQKTSKGVIADLDRQIASNSVDVESAHITTKVNGIMKDLPQNSALCAEDFMHKFNDEGASLITTLKIKFNPTKESIEQGDAKGLLKIYNSTTKENIDFRLDFLDTTYFNYGKRDRMGKNEINELAGLFELADKDPNTMKFLGCLSAEGASLKCAGAYLELIDKVGSERLSSDSKKVAKLIKSEHWEPLQTVIDYYEKGPEGVVDKVFASIKGIFGSRKQKPIVPVSDLVKIDKMTQRTKKPYIAPSIKIVPMERESLLPTGKIEMPVAKEVSASISETAPVKKAKRSYLTFTPYVPKQPSAKKLLVINDVNKVIEKKLGSKVYAEQSGLYADKATKMRLSLLPEIFESIKETRAAERANGTFNRSKSVKNEDAVDSYTRINGKNKKLVNYMLKKRNADGTRMFSVKDILDTLADANREIIIGQNNSTKLNRFTAKDERAIYENIFEQKVTEFGKLQRARSAKKA